MSMMLMVAIILFESVRRWIGPAGRATVSVSKPVTA